MRFREHPAKGVPPTAAAVLDQGVHAGRDCRVRVAQRRHQHARHEAGGVYEPLHAALLDTHKGQQDVLEEF